MTNSTHTETATHRLRRAVSAIAIAFAAASGVSLMTDSVVAAESPESVEAITPTIAGHANAAVAALADHEATDDPEAMASYRRHRAHAAILTAQFLGYDPQQMVRAWSDTTHEHQKAVLGALTQLGVPYRYASSEAGVGFDCSGLTSFGWRNAGYDLARNSGGQISAAQSLDRSQAKAGDLVYYPGHVMLYLGVGDAIVHSVHSGRDVELDHISSRRSVRFGDPTV